MNKGSLLAGLGFGVAVIGLTAYYSQILQFVNTSLNSSGSNGFQQGHYGVTVPEPGFSGTALMGIGALVLLGLRKRNK